MRDVKGQKGARPGRGGSGRRLLAAALIVGVGACRPLPPPGETRTPPPPPAERQADADREARPAISDSMAAVVAAIVDSVEAVVRDSIENESRMAATRRDSADAARQDSIRAAEARADAARRDSIAAAARRDSILAEIRRDSIAAAIQDSIQQAMRDSVAAQTRRDSLAEVARLDSMLALAAATDSAGAFPPAAAEASEDLEQLRALGPVYIPYDESPRLIWDTESQAMVARGLLPIVRGEGMPARTRTSFWLLVSADGVVADLVIQTSSGNADFDQAASAVARRLRFRPAIRGQRAVPTWVIRDVSLIMQQ